MGIFTNVLVIVEIVVGLGLLIFVHELGHFLLAKFHKVRVEAFSLGFPPNLLKRRWGETEYRIGMIPLGGYVKMAGEAVGEGTGAPDELQSKPAWARVQIFAAGAVINLLVAFPLAILACWVGRIVDEPRVSAPALPEVRAGMRPGDTILSVDGEPVDSRERYLMMMVSKGQGAEVEVRVRRLDGAEETLKVVQGGTEAHQIAPTSTTLDVVKEGSPAWTAGLRPGDQVVEIEGRRVFDGGELNRALRWADRPVPWSSFAVTRPVRFAVSRREEKGERSRHDVALWPEAKSEWYFPEAQELVEPVVGEAAKFTGAWDVLKTGDRILAVDDITVESWRDLKRAVEPRGGRTVKVRVRRGDKEETVEVLLAYQPATGLGVLGIRPRPTKTVADVDPNGPWAGKLLPGDVLVGVGLSGKDRPGLATGDISTMQAVPMWTPPEPPPVPREGDAIEVKVERLDEPLRVATRERAAGDIAALGLEDNGFGQLVIVNDQFIRYWGPGEGVTDGLKEPVRMIELTVQMLGRLVSGRESAGNLAGPLGIFQASYRSAQKSTGNFFWILVLITVNLGVFNLLPIPVLDGGHIVLLGIEVVRGRPNSPRFVELFQIAGLILLLTLVVFVTVLDVRRIW